MFLTFEKQHSANRCDSIIPSFDKINFMDSCADFSVANKHQFDPWDARVLSLEEQFSFEGSNEGAPVLQTHFGCRRVWAGSSHHHEGAFCGEGNKCNLTSTDVLASNACPP